MILHRLKMFIFNLLRVSESKIIPISTTTTKYDDDMNTIGTNDEYLYDIIKDIRNHIVLTKEQINYLKITSGKNLIKVIKLLSFCNDNLNNKLNDLRENESYKIQRRITYDSHQLFQYQCQLIQYQRQIIQDNYQIVKRQTIQDKRQILQEQIQIDQDKRQKNIDMISIKDR